MPTTTPPPTPNPSRTKDIAGGVVGGVVGLVLLAGLIFLSLKRRKNGEVIGHATGRSEHEMCHGQDRSEGRPAELHPGLQEMVNGEPHYGGPVELDDRLVLETEGRSLS